MNIFKDKKIIIVGPAINQPSDAFLKKFDFVIRTNNFINSSLAKKRCDILLLNNVTAKSLDMGSLSKIHKSNIKYIMCYGGHIGWLKKLLPTKKFIRIEHQKLLRVGKTAVYFGSSPTIIYIFIMNLMSKHRQFNKVFIDGIDFYMGRKRYVPGYAWSIHRREQNSHNINTDRKFLLFLLRRIKKINTTGYIKRLTKI